MLRCKWSPAFSVALLVLSTCACLSVHTKSSEVGFSEDACMRMLQRNVSEAVAWLREVSPPGASASAGLKAGWHHCRGAALYLSKEPTLSIPHFQQVWAQGIAHACLQSMTPLHVPHRLWLLLLTTRPHGATWLPPNVPWGR